ncbi:MAG: tRNA uridine-5-carboxymethylaminomethyl(34) synthesis enzyme MnmG [Planctomycetota bacterium]|jgi:tRNA uridine 5-carboxymethylaminomethyl modification enzyme|nr:tRNA uridine-5-carboxymethylaminomethyl(34) synthesis enzyme MnmG [Planctomycetota bacterium]
MLTQVVVVGGGHAGCEAALASARLGADTVLVTINPDKIGHVSCNPAIGGVGKGQLVREIDALGGMMGLAADANAIQYRMLNSSKGPAVRSPRAQIDRWAYQNWVKARLEREDRLTIVQDQAAAVEVRDGRVAALRTFFGKRIRCRAVVVCAGTFSRARLHLGELEWSGGRNGEPAARWLSDSLASLGLELFRLRTDTCPRIDGRSVDFSKLGVESGDENPQPFSFLTERADIEQLPCHTAWTNERTFEAVREVLDRSPAMTGRIDGLPPRYCPNIETKVARFPEKRTHHLFIEPEGRNSNEMYLNGFSTSIPPEAQEEMIRSVPGLEKAHVVRYGYAVEYDAVRPTQLRDTLETKRIGGLFTAGQVNGTSGYEEAAAQGLLAGTNAALQAAGRPPFRLSRAEAYIGVLVDDLTTRGTDEPYRLFTSRAENRLVLRQDNADLRLTGKARRIGLVDRDRFGKTLRLEAAVLAARRLAGTLVCGDGLSAEQLLRRPEETWESVAARFPELADVPARAAEQVEIETKYAGYIERQRRQIARLEKSGRLEIPDGFDFNSVVGLSREAKEKLTRIRPETLAQALAVSGVSPADGALLLVKLRRRGR